MVCINDGRLTGEGKSNRRMNLNKGWWSHRWSSSMCASPARSSAGATLGPPSAARPRFARPGMTPHAHTPPSSCLWSHSQLGSHQMTSNRDRHTLGCTSRKIRHPLSLFLYVHVGPIIARLCVCLSFCLLPSVPFGPRLGLGLGTQKIFPCKTSE